MIQFIVSMAAVAFDLEHHFMHPGVTFDSGIALQRALAVQMGGGGFTAFCASQG